MQLKSSKKKKSGGFFTLFTFLFFLALVGVGLFFMFNDQDAPLVVALPNVESAVAMDATIAVEIGDEKSGLKVVTISLVQGENVFDVYSEIFTDQPQTLVQEIALSEYDLEEGAFTVEVEARDASFSKILSGNEANVSLAFTLDTTLPEISYITSPPAIRRGGTGLIKFSASDDVATVGVNVGEYFFPAYLDDDGNYFCLFPFPYYLDTSNYDPRIFAEDNAGNVLDVDLPVVAVNHVFPDDAVHISESFLELKDSELRRISPSDEPALDLYIRVNNEVRAENALTILEVSKDTADTFYWEGAFQRQPRSASQANFGDSRTYMYEGTRIDFQYHLGIDLASVREDIIQASNRGRVIFADYLGIYGYTVILDHGCNLQSLYSHMTDMHVEVGEIVEKGHDLGTTGVTGLAVGDHVHFGILIGGIPVQPLEWLDANWLESNITSRLEEE